METFKQYTKNKTKRTFLYDSLPNSHGSHALNNEQKKVYNSIKLKRKKIIEFTEDTKHVNDWLDENDNHHLGSNEEFDDVHPQMQKLHELHGEPSPRYTEARKALQRYTSESGVFNKSLMNGTTNTSHISLKHLKKISLQQKLNLKPILE